MRAQWVVSIVAAAALAVVIVLLLQPQPAVPTEVVQLNRDYLIGRWSDHGDCNDATEFRRDGTWTRGNLQGHWRLDGELLIFDDPGTHVESVSVVDRNSMLLIQRDREPGHPTRCP